MRLIPREQGLRFITKGKHNFTLHGLERALFSCLFFGGHFPTSLALGDFVKSRGTMGLPVDQGTSVQYRVAEQHSLFHMTTACIIVTVDAAGKWNGFSSEIIGFSQLHAVR